VSSSTFNLLEFLSLSLFTIYCLKYLKKRESIYRLVGPPVPNSSLYGTVEQMMRVFVGVNKRSSDIHTNNTYYAIKILSVIIMIYLF